MEHVLFVGTYGKKKKKKDAQESDLPARVTLQVQMGGGDSIRFGK